MMDHEAKFSLLRKAQRLSGRLPERLDRNLRELGKLCINYRGARRSLFRGTAFALAGRHSQLLLAPFGRGKLLVDAKDQAISRVVFMRGDFERIYMQTAVHYLQSRLSRSTEGMAFLDVGANIGTATVDALLHFGFSNAFCFEPDSRSFKLLRMNLLLNDLESRATPFRVALSNWEGTGHLRRSRGNFGDTRLIAPRAYVGDKNIDNEIAECIKLDSLVEQGVISPKKVGLVWMDTQGHEASVLAGAGAFRKAGVPIVVEYWPEGLKATQSLDLMEDLIRADYDQVVDIRMLSHGLESEAVLPAKDVGKLRQRYQVAEATDLLLVL